MSEPLINVSTVHCAEVCPRTKQSDLIYDGLLIALILHEPRATSRVIHVCRDWISWIQLGADKRQSISVQVLHTCMLAIALFRPDIMAKTKMKRNGGIRPRSAADILEVNHLRLVDGSIGEPALVGGFVQDHSVFHVVACVGYHCNDGIGTTGEGIHGIRVVEMRADDRCLACLKSVQFVVRSVLESGGWGSHCLFSHLNRNDQNRHTTFFKQDVPDIGRCYEDSMHLLVHARVD